MFTFWKDCNLRIFDCTLLSPRTYLSPYNLIAVLSTLLKLSLQHQQYNQGHKSNDLLFHPQPTCFLFTNLDCWWIPSSWRFLLRGLPKHCPSVIPSPSFFSSFSFSSPSYFCTQMRCSPMFLPWPSSLLPLSSLVISFNLIFLITFFVGIPAKVGNY